MKNLLERHKTGLSNDKHSKNAWNKHVKLQIRTKVTLNKCNTAKMTLMKAGKETLYLKMNGFFRSVFIQKLKDERRNASENIRDPGSRYLCVTRADFIDKQQQLSENVSFKWVFRVWIRLKIWTKRELNCKAGTIRHLCITNISPTSGAPKPVKSNQLPSRWWAEFQHAQRAHPGPWGPTSSSPPALTRTKQQWW